VRPFNFIENLAEGVVEGPVNRLFGSKIAPVEIQKRLERIMEQKCLIAQGGKAFVPNRYEVYLNPENFQQLTESGLPKAELEKNLLQHVMNYARLRNFIFGGGAPLVWVYSDTNLKKRQLAINAMTVDAQQVRQAAPQNPAFGSDIELAQSLDQGATQFFAPGEIASATSGHGVAMPPAYLQVTRYPQPPENLPVLNPSVSIGRDATNDIMLDDRRLSRRHAKIEFRYGQFILFDLKSTNGTTVNGQPVTQFVLSPGDVISFGGKEAVFQV
jgi:Protein of unknown function (DUF3662)/FHA domain